ncbi:MAG: CotH kinase family protein [Crocinitomicaceae bacterium]
MKLIVTILFVFVLCFSRAQEKPELVFTPIGGVYEKPTTVTMDAGEDASIYYTLDGTYPGSGSFRYKGPIEVSDVKLFRAVAYKNGKRSNVVTQTYVCDREYDLAVVSIATHPDNLFSYETGIYVKGCCADTIEPYLGANFWKDWEKPANIEMYDEEGALCFNQNVGINLFGGFSRMLPQKSLAVFARSKYGDKRIRYKLFPDRDSKKYKSFILRNSGGDFLRTHIRDAFMTQLAKPTGVAIQEYRPAVVFINGEYWGIQNIREKISEHYLAQNFDVDKENVDILRHNGVKRHGYSTNYKKLLAYLRSTDLSKDKNMDHLRTFVDVEDYIRYNIAEVYSDNRDAGGNIRYWRERNDSAKWRWVFYDLDLGLGNNNPSGYKRNTLDKFTRANAEAWPDPSWSTFIIRSLLSNKQVENQYINTFADHLNTVYHQDTAMKLVDEMEARIDSEMKYHQKRWGSSYENWKHQISLLEIFVKRRPFYVRKHIMQKFDLKDTLNINIVHPGKEICSVHFSSLDLERDYNGVYFKNVPISIRVSPKHDYKFVGWSDGSEEGPERTFIPQKDLEIKPIIEPKERGVFADSIVFNEIAFFQPEADTSQDWIELYNRSNQAIEITGWTLTDKSFKKGWNIPEGTVVPAKSFLVLAQNLASFKTSYPGDTLTVLGDFDFGLSAEGELLKLYDEHGLIVDSLTYTSISDTGLFTIARPHPDSLNIPANRWKVEPPTPSYHNKAYLNYLQTEADKAKWTKLFYIGGGSFFFILISGFIWFRYSKRKKRAA